MLNQFDLTELVVGAANSIPLSQWDDLCNIFHDFITNDSGGARRLLIKQLSSLMQVVADDPEGTTTVILSARQSGLDRSPVYRVAHNSSYQYIVPTDDTMTSLEHVVQFIEDTLLLIVQLAKDPNRLVDVQRVLKATREKHALEEAKMSTWVINKAFGV